MTKKQLKEKILDYIRDMTLKYLFKNIAIIKDVELGGNRKGLFIKSNLFCLLIQGKTVFAGQNVTFKLFEEEDIVLDTHKKMQEMMDISFKQSKNTNWYKSTKKGKGWIFSK